jgi:hypothetical protein
VWQKKAADERRRRGDQAERGRKTRNGGPVLFLLQAATHFKGSSTHYSHHIGTRDLAARCFGVIPINAREKGGTMMPFPTGVRCLHAVFGSETDLAERY